MNVFLSYTPDTNEIAERLAQDLRAHQVTPVYDRAHAGGNFWSTERAAMRQNADAWVFLVGRERDSWVEREWSSAVDESWDQPEKRLIPLIVGDAEPPPFLLERQAIRLTDAHPADSGDWDETVDTVLDALQGRSRHGTAKKATATQKREREERIRTLEQQAADSQPTAEQLRQRVEPLELLLASQQAADEPEAARTAAQLADIMKALQERARAVEFLGVALEVQQRHLQPTDAAIARTHANLATHLSTLERREEARDHLEKAAAIYGKAEGTESFAYGLAELRLAGVLQQLGETDAAARHRQVAIDVGRAVGLRAIRSIPLLGPIFDRIVKSGRSATSDPPGTPKRTVPKKRTSTKPASTKSVSKKSAPKQAASTKSVSKKSASKKSASKKSVSKKSAPKKSAPKKSGSSRTAGTKKTGSSSSGRRGERRDRNSTPGRKP